MSQYNKLLDQKKLSGPNTKNVVGPKETIWANKLGGPNIKLGGPVPGRPTSSAATAEWCY